MRYEVQYARIEHQVYLLEVEADSVEEAEEKAEEEFTGDEEYEVVHAEEFVLEVNNLEEVEDD